MSEPVTLGDTFLIMAGCDKQFSTCQAKFDNVANLSGFPHMAGNDFAQSVANPRRQGRQE
jgi:uncharacterized phage protein (TIGR02218 family)